MGENDPIPANNGGVAHWSTFDVELVPPGSHLDPLLLTIFLFKYLFILKKLSHLQRDLQKAVKETFFIRLDPQPIIQCIFSNTSAQ